MRPGELRHRVALQRSIRTDDGGGGVAETWQTVAHLWAAIEPLRGGEAILAEKLEGRITHSAVLRWRGDVGTSMRFLFGTRVLEIDSALSPGEERRWLVCKCVERVPA